MLRFQLRVSDSSCRPAALERQAMGNIFKTQKKVLVSWFFALNLQRPLILHYLIHHWCKAVRDKRYSMDSEFRM